jgi:hypothetical protein
MASFDEVMTLQYTVGCSTLPLQCVSLWSCPTFDDANSDIKRLVHHAWTELQVHCVALGAAILYSILLT